MSFAWPSLLDRSTHPTNTKHTMTNSESRSRGEYVADLVTALVLLIFASLSHEAVGAGADQGAAQSSVPKRSEQGAVGRSEGAKTIPAPTAWVYSRETEPMGRGVIEDATTKSMNAVELGWPYGTQWASLTLRKHPKHGQQIVLIVEKGQFLCHVGECSTAIRFDGGKVQTFESGSASTGASNYIFLRSFGRFVGQVKKAKRMQVEVHFYQVGARVFEFDVAGLNF
jgi:hypothetical protein